MTIRLERNDIINFSQEKGKLDKYIRSIKGGATHEGFYFKGMPQVVHNLSFTWDKTISKITFSDDGKIKYDK
jgi:hypothetical protein